MLRNEDTSKEIEKAYMLVFSKTTNEADALVTPTTYTSNEPTEGEHPVSESTTEATRRGTTTTTTEATRRGTTTTTTTTTTEEERKIISMLNARNYISGIKACDRSVDQKKKN